MEDVPGCIGEGEPAMDYCYNPGPGFKRLTFVGNEENDWYSLGQCEGGTEFEYVCGIVIFALGIGLTLECWLPHTDCDWDSDCKIGYICYEREGGDSGNVPTCIGNANTVGFGNDDFCIPRPTPDTLMSVFENEDGSGGLADGGIYPIPKCAGDCDSGEWIERQKDKNFGSVINGSLYFSRLI